MKKILLLSLVILFVGCSSTREDEWPEVEYAHIRNIDNQTYINVFEYHKYDETKEYFQK